MVRPIYFPYPAVLKGSGGANGWAELLAREVSRQRIAAWMYGQLLPRCRESVLLDIKG